ncbi:YaaR family protein [Paenibacillus aurantius]|uniref:YaaR family protein n=1 Tax=Paenibacillus aurantius TaxID=2918900 RepID=A0AA96RF69_9BACL|nr:YaaR family protein [Paenibacillus aurantius]WJH36351.1 YaaR family protein [Paenibacillus sp. CC-CFT747]WNQ11652.1 YaaR family protein [Paenibacillus aurantius]
MKINPGWRPLGKDIKLPDSSNPAHVQQKSFSEMMQHQDVRASHEELNRIMEQIHLQGERLSKAMTVRELRQYKLLVKRFLEETARRGIVLRDTRGWDRRGRTKRYKLLEEIDEALVGMADDLLDQEQGRIELLQKIGEIRGMLINLFF